MVERSDATILGNDVPRSEGTADTTIIRAEIRETRERMGDTIEEIGERLNPNRLKEQVKENIRDATIGRVENMAQGAVDRVNETRRTFMNVVRDNPIPSAMVGIGLGWLFFNRRERDESRIGSRHVSRRARGFSDVSLGYGGGTELGGPYAEPGAAYGAARGSGGAGGVGESVKETAGELADRAQDVAGDVAERTRVQAERLRDQFYENPLAIATATLALGLAAGLAVPATEAETELVGSARDKLVDRVRNVARETGEKVTQVAERVMDETQATAKAGAETQPAI